MKRPYLWILLIALILTSVVLFYNRSTPFQPTLHMTAPSPLAADLLSTANTGAVNLQTLSQESPGTAGYIASDIAVPVNAAPPPVQASLAMAGQIVPSGMQRQIIGRAGLELVVDDTEEVVAQIKQLMTVVGGYVANAHLYRTTIHDQEYLQGTLNLRVPSAQMDAALAKLEQMGKEARSQTLSREDVTDQYTDLDAQLRNLKATENELRELLAEVRKKPNARPDDILAVHRSMTDIRSQIEQAQGRKNMLDNLVDLATIDMTLTPHVVTSPVIIAESEQGWQPMTVVRSAFHDLVGTMQDFANVGIWLVIYFVPVVVAVCLPVGLLYLLWRVVIVRWQRRSLVTGAGD